MKTTTMFWTVAGLIRAAAAVPAQASSETPTPTTSGPAPTCTAALVTKLCDYPQPGPDFAKAYDKESCWQYCNRHGPCNFVIFAAGNPNTGSGTCWLYPGETFDASKGRESGCANPYLSVYDKPTCTGGASTGPGNGVPSQCSAAVATPSSQAEICGYPTPPDGCFAGCAASRSASECLAQCAKADACSYVVFNPGNPSKSPYSSGNCWMYPEGTYDSSKGETCSGKPDQYVYNNTCPRPSPTTSKASSSTGGTGHADGTMVNKAGGASTTTSDNAAPTGVVLSHGLVVGAAALAWNAL
ncbi:hypothetical protein LEL_08606 [Akanthomyces lecanii RCEF 1005]|uniref:Apple domain-containing protein n=1 Tax=Akanthomyces lecanii RCEF 1005 TaxID=1081108 RepID=A0A162JRV0_CORDF|nr:hypothetical protein LEL_08606 [Akanthomyces lecanii RCEF 1005]